MSNNEITFGYMGALVAPVPEEDRDAISELLNNYGLGINYEGTLIYETNKSFDLDDGEGFGMHVLPNKDGSDDFYDAVWKSGFKLNRSTIRPFVDLWYNATDSTHSEITLEEFLKKIAEAS